MASWKTIATSGDKLSIFSATTSAELRGVISDESGTGVAIFAGGDIGDASATTQASGNDTTKIATTAFVTDAVSGENTIAEMNDVVLTSVENKNILVYDDDAGSPDDVWKNVALTGDVSITNAGVASLRDHNDTRSNLGLAIGSDVQAYDAQLADLAGLAVTNSSFIVGDGSNFVLEDASTSRTSLGLGDSATGDIGSEVQAHSGRLDKFATGTTADGAMWIGTGTGEADWALESGQDLHTSLGLAIGSNVQAYNATYVVDADIGGSVQAQDDVLDDLSALSVIANDEIMVGTDAGVYANESGATLRTSIGVGSGNTPTFLDLKLNGGDIEFTTAGTVSASDVASGTGLKVAVHGGDGKAGIADLVAGGLEIAGGQGTGTGAGGDIVFKVAPPAVGTATTQNALATALTISDDKSATFTGAVAITGNLTVSGATITTLSEEVKFEDNVLVLNSNASGWPGGSQDAGWEVERGSGTNSYIQWDESAHEWIVRSMMSSANNTTAEDGRLAVIERKASGTAGSSTAVGSMFINTATSAMYVYM